MCKWITLVSTPGTFGNQKMLVPPPHDLGGTENTRDGKYQLARNEELFKLKIS